MSWSDWVQEGPLRARFRMDATGSKTTHRLVKEVNQPDRNLIMADTANLRKEAELGNGPRDLSFGRLVGRIPIVDFIRIQENHPDLFSPDGEAARKATIKFFNSSDGAKYRIKRA